MNSLGDLSRNQPQVRIYDTQDVNARERLAYLNEGIQALLSPTETASMTENIIDFSARLKNISFGELSFTECNICAIKDVRTRKMLTAKPDEDFYLLNILEGRGQLDHSGSNLNLSPGDIVMYDSAREFSLQFSQGTTLHIARFSRNHALAKVPGADKLAARLIKPSSPFNAMVSNVIRGGLAFSEHQEILDFDTARYTLSTSDLLSTCLELALLPSAPSTRSQGLLGKAKRLLMDNVANPHYGLVELAIALNASPRTVCRAFAAEGTTPIRWLWMKRLEMAKDLLEAKSTLTIGDIAFRYGFSDFSHFSRAFKKAYGKAPSAVRAS